MRNYVSLDFQFELNCFGINANQLQVPPSMADDEDDKRGMIVIIPQMKLRSGPCNEPITTESKLHHECRFTVQSDEQQFLGYGILLLLLIPSN